MSTTITVQGSAGTWVDAERGTLSISASFDGPEREDVFSQATATANAVAALIEPLVDAGAGPVTRWSSDRVHVWSSRPWNDQGKQLPPVYHASIGARAEFSDPDALARVIEQLAVEDGVTLGSVEWDLTEQRRREVEDAVRADAVADAVHKAQTYARAAGIGTPVVNAIADPGMLGDGSAGGGAPVPMQRTAFAGAMDASPESGSLTLSPDRIHVTASVDVRFQVG